MEPTQEMVDLNNILLETITFLGNEAHYRDIKIETDLSPKVPRVNTDQSQLQQVFLNIINNAIDAIKKEGIIKVITSYDTEKSDHVLITIADNGPGISRDNINKIFDPFFTTKSANEGTGLGLSISYSIIEKLGGKIEVETEVGQGTTFKIFVPTKS
jgi:two-component system NtrC family sensor kinase